MQDDEKVISNLVAAINDDSLSQWRNVLMNESSKPELLNQFVETLIDDMTESGLERSFAVSNAMRCFERISEWSESISCILMAHLWRHASTQSGLHDICDAIVLWLTNCKSTELGIHLRYLAASSTDEAVRQHFRHSVDCHTS